MMSPSDLLATPVLNAFQNVALAIIIERQNKLNFSDQCQTKFLLPKSQNEFYDLLPIPSCISSTKTKVKDMENMLIFSMSLYKFKSSLCSPCNHSTQRRRKVYRCWVSSSPIKRANYETCKCDVNHHGCAHHQGENQIHFLQCRKYPMDSSHRRCQIFTPPFEMNSIPYIQAVTHPDFSTYRPSSTGKYIRMPLAEGLHSNHSSSSTILQTTVVHIE